MTTQGIGPDDIVIDSMTFAEAQSHFELARQEGWNPGLHDCDCAWAVDPDAFVALRHDGDIIGGGSIFRHSDAFGFMGLFIVKPEYRRLGAGKQLWQERFRRLRARLAPGASIGMDGVFQMEGFYKAGGFHTQYETVRYTGMATCDDPAQADLCEEGGAISDLLAYDRAHTGYDRSGLLRAWLEQDQNLIAVHSIDGRISGFAIARPAFSGYKIGPLLADTPAIASALLDNLFDRLVGHFVQIDVPTPNSAAVALVQSHQFTPDFGCARMYCGDAPSADLSHIFGGMSFEFG